jgi:Lamin Tail Domain/CotH kinase protein/Bacterial Ig domain
MNPSRLFSPRLAALAGAFALIPGARAGVLVDLDATALPNGPLVTWTNTGSLAGNFTRETDTPSVTTVAGVNGVTLDGSNDWFVGPAAPAAVTGNGSRSIFVWLYNGSASTEETVFAWGRRGGPTGSDMSFNHGNNASYGAVAHWDAPDMGWNGKQENGVWTCIAYSYDSASGVASVYTNGILSNSESVGTLATHATSTGGQPLPFVVGCQNANNGVRDNNQFPGSFTIAKIKVHDLPLTEEQIVTAYNADAAAFGRIPATVITAFTASPSPLYQGNSATLQWTAIGATSLSISPGGPLASGTTSVNVSPAATTTYTLTATGPSGTVSRTTTVTVDPGTPVANHLTFNASQDAALPVTLTASDPNTPLGNLTWPILTTPAHGVLSGTAPILTYTPDSGFSGTDSFSFRVNDGISDSNTATVTLNVNPPPAAASSVTASVSEIPSSAVSGSFIGHLRSTDPNFNESHTYQLVSGTGATDNGLFSISGNQLIAQHAFADDIGTTFSIRVRSTDSTSLSSEHVLTFTVVASPATIVINEIFYNPANNGRTEFVELHNPTAAPVALDGWQFTSGITYTFPGSSTIPSGGYLAIAQDAAAYQAQFGVPAFGQYTGKLSGDGELIELRNSSNVIVDQVDYRTEFPWPVSADGAGSSMELIHPSLDNNLAGSWRASVSLVNFPQLTYVPTTATGWRWRPGTTEASSPDSTLWRENGFVEDGTWSTGRTSIGYGTVNNLTRNTTVTGMQNVYRSLFARKTFSIAAGEIPASVKLRYSADDGIIIWINGHFAARRNMASVTPTINSLASATGTEGLWYEVDLDNASTFLVEGVNTIAIQLFNQTIDSSDLGFDVELRRPAGSFIIRPSPASQNTVYSTLAAPQIRQVDHSPLQPTSADTTTVTAKVTDPQGVGSVQLHYQVVLPGAFIPARTPRTVAQVLADPDGERPLNPAFENPSNWTTVTMRDDATNGDATAADGVFTAVLPARDHRTLVRYRITVTDLPGTSVRVPYADDQSLNFAYFVYNGVPDYVASTASVTGGAGKIWPKSLLTSVPVYHWLIRPEDMQSLQAYNGSQQFPNNETDEVLAARRSEEWEGAFVYDGVVYDHVNTRLRGGNSRYGDNESRFTYGKRHYKFAFNRGHRFQAKDQNGNPYPQKWKSLAVNKMFGNKGGNGWGMPEEIGATLWSTFGVPAANTHWFHFRVIDGAAEAPDQYNGDFWGIQQVIEEYESTFLEARDMTKGNLYKMSDWIWDAERQRRYQSPDMVNDGSEFNNIRDNLHGGQSAAWLQEHVNYDKWYRYSAVAEAIRHYDLFPYTEDIRHALKNLAWYFEPTGTDPTRGVCTFLPYDWDASFGPNWNNGWEHANNALYGWDSSTSNGMPYIDKPDLKIAHRNTLREFRDLIWQPDQVNNLMDDRAAVIAELSLADQDRWRNAPQASGTANDDTLVYKVQDMKNFCFTGWVAPGGPSVGPTVGAGGRAVYLDGLADNADAGQLPAKPVISYTGAPNHPLNGLSFSTSAFSDPQGAGTFAGMAWRIGRIEDPAAPAHDPDEEFILEYTPVWESGLLSTYQNSVAIPAGALKPGATYRARVRMKDATGRWSHWSAPYQFTTTAPAGLTDLQQNLMITEIMYNPAGPALPGMSKEDFEYIELQNISTTLTLDLTDVRFTKGIDFDFVTGSILTLAPGARAVVVKNLTAFQSRYGSVLPVAGVWDVMDNLANGGEELKLSYGAGIAIHEFEFDDASPWPTSPDGNGPSLQLIDPLATPPDLGNGLKWRASTTPDGSPGNPDSRFAVWLARRDTTDPAAEPIPGMSHLLMYALGADLLGNPADALPAATFTAGSGSDEHLTLSYRTRSGGTDVTYIPETGTDLTGWNSGPEFIEPYGTPVDNGDGTVTVQARVILPRSADSTRFIRLRIVLEP